MKGALVVGISPKHSNLSSFQAVIGLIESLSVAEIVDSSSRDLNFTMIKDGTVGVNSLFL